MECPLVVCPTEAVSVQECLAAPWVDLPMECNQDPLAQVDKDLLMLVEPPTQETYSEAHPAVDLLADKVASLNDQNPSLNRYYLAFSKH